MRHSSFEILVIQAVRSVPGPSVLGRKRGLGGWAQGSQVSDQSWSVGYTDSNHLNMRNILALFSVPSSIGGRPNQVTVNF